MSKLVGYMEGTNPQWLTTLQMLGCDTLPLSNGQDGHGMNIQLLTQASKPDMIICWLHKLAWPKYYEVTPKELLHSTEQYEIPVVIACPSEFHGQVPQVLGELPQNVRLTDPDDVLALLRSELT